MSISISVWRRMKGSMSSGDVDMLRIIRIGDVSQLTTALSISYITTSTLHTHIHPYIGTFQHLSPNYKSLQNAYLCR